MNTAENELVMSRLGGFVILWAVFDGVLDAGIQKQLSITDEQAAIVTCGLAFERKASILKSLLNLKPGKHQDAVHLISKISEIARRNVLLHGTPFFGKDFIEFVKLDTENKLKARSHRHTPASIDKAVQQMGALVEALQAQLGVTEAERAAIPKIGARLAASKA